jgi:gliding motility-associated-like protein
VKKTFCLYIILFSLVNTASADHITGGEIFYTLKSISANQYTYAVTVKMYMDCNSYREFYNPTYVSVFDKSNGARVRDLYVPLTNIEVINLTGNDECITNPPKVCHRIGYYIFDLTLPASPNGYVLTTEVFFRVNNMRNLTPGYENIGATYTAEIPGTFILPTGPKNNSAKFVGNDLVIICAGNEFEYSFAAEDKDGDKLSYSLCNAYRSDNFMFGVDATPPAAPPYSAVPYSPEYSGARPFGGNVTINGATGLINGIAPSPGTYVITVCVEEWRDEKFIATQRKDLQINVASCSFTSASLEDTYLLCDNTKTIAIENLSTSPLIESYKWLITDQSGATIYTATSPSVNYTFNDTGLYNIHLDVNPNAKCMDSTNSIIRVYPGFVTDFSYSGICLNKSTQFTDATSSVYGAINSWHWNFTGDVLSDAVSTLQNPVHAYTSKGNKSVSLIATDSKGCIDTVYKTIEIFDKPPVLLAFGDTLICKPDTLQLIATGNGIYSWSPANSIINPGSSSPTVIPQKSATYYVDLDLDGCTNRDSVTVNVVDHVTLQAMKDTIICSGDPIQLTIASDGLKYIWSPASQLNDATIQQPLAVTNTDTKYMVTASIGNCIAKEEINVKTIPYPLALAGQDTIICFGTAAFLNGTTNGSSFSWSPPTNVSNINALNTTAVPVGSTTYIFTAYDTKGCPKPGIDSVSVTVLPEIFAYAGHDTAVVINQPLQLNGSGGTAYQWVPSTGLSSSAIPDPVALFYYPSDGNRYKLLVTNQAGCTDSAFVTVKVYKTLPSVFVPSGFTPNRDGKNDILRPILAGMERIEIFSVYNRLGQLVFSTSETGRGWDGTVAGILQNTGTFVWMVKAIDYSGKPYFKKGTVTLIR